MSLALLRKHQTINQTMQSDQLSNNINVSEPFKYPTETLSVTEILSQERDIKAEAEKETAEFLNRFLSILLPSKNIRLELIAFAMASGLNVGMFFGCDNTLTAVAKQLGVSKQLLSVHIKQLSTTFNLHTNTGINETLKPTYAKTNIHKPSR